MSYDPQAIESEWRDRWDETGRYESDPADDPDGEATFVTVPYPYPSGGMHIGHARTYTVPDVYARYRRLQGDNVCFPIAWHVTGTPIVGAVERLKNEDPEQIESLQDAFGVPREDLQSLETPMGFARYFIEEAESSYKTGMQGLGLSIDWRREFTTNDERYSKFVQWQYRTLKQRGLLEKGLHPVKYCTNEDNPVTTHDLLEGEEADYQEYTLVKFRDADLVVPMATLRPETVRGVTNAYVDPEAEYATAEVDDEHWLVSVAATEKLRLQARDVEVHETFSGADLVGERVTNPVTGDEILVLPAGFVDADNATGVVMSVPAHSPDDYLALQEAKADHERLERYGIDPDEVAAIEPVPILEIDGYGEIPARDAVEAAGIEDSQDPELEAVTADLYQDEFHSGRLLASYGEFAGEVIAEVRDRFRDHHAETGAFGSMYEFSEEVVCRCGGDVEVAEQDTWFLRYDDEDWTEKTRRAIENLECIPESTRDQYDNTVDWLEEWPCIRNYGLGTRLPWDDEFVIEPLSDSTIYMSYYTIAHRIQDVPLEECDDDFFDTLLLGDGDHETAQELREEWDYWYPVDYRCSGNDLIQNHLTFYLYHHAELFPEPKWPQGITVMGMGLLEGEKMSSSKGHVVLPGEAIDDFGADTVRFFLLNSAEPWQDYDWREDQVRSTRDALERFYERGEELAESAEPRSADGRAAEPRDGPAGERDLERVDRWLLAKLQETVATVTEALDSFETRTASQAAFYDFREHLRWYRRRIASDEAGAGGSDRRRTGTDRAGARWTLRKVLETRLRLLAPFVPFLANDLHERLTGEPAEDAAWPSVDDEFADDVVVAEEQLVENLRDDVGEVIDVTGEDPETVRVFVAADWKRDVFETVREVGPDRGQVMSEVMSDPDLRDRGDAVNDLVGDLVELVRERADDRLAALSGVDEDALYEDAASFLEREFDADVDVVAEDDPDLDDPEGRADAAVPFRPAIHLE